MIQRSVVDPVLHRLQRALDTGVPREEVAEALAAAETAAQQSGEGLSSLLRYRADEYIQAERMLERRRLVFAVACVVFIFATVVGGFGLTTLDRMRSLVDYESQFDKLVSTEEWQQASAFLDELDQQTQSEPAFVRGREMVDQALAREVERKAEFKRLSDQIRASREETITAQTVERLNELARSEEEIEFAAEMHSKAEEQRLEREAARANDQTHEFETLQDKVDRFLSVESKELPREEIDTRRFELQQELGRFVAAHQLGNPELSEAAKQAGKMLAASAELERKRTDRDKLVGAITDSVGNPELYTSAINRFIKQWPRDALAGRLQQDAPGAPAIEATLAWIRVLNHSGFRQPQLVDGRIAKDWLAALDHAESLERDHPLSKQATDWRDEYRSIVDSEDAIKELREAFRSPLVNRIYVYPDPSGSTHYSEQAPDQDSQRSHIVSVLVDTALRRETKNFGLRFRDDVFPNVRLAGHSQFAAKVSQSVSDVGATDFTPTAYRLISELRTFQSEPEFDPIYRLIWMRRILQIAVRGSIPIKIAFGDWLESIEASDFDWETNWLAADPNDLERFGRLTQAKRLLENVDDWDKRVERMLAEFKAFRSPRPVAPRWIGWVSYAAEHYVAELSKSTDSKSTESQQLVVFAFDSETKRTNRVDIGPPLTSGLSIVTDPGAQRCGAIICVIPPSPSANL